MADPNDKAIVVHGVSKNFVLPHEKKTSVKSVFTGLFKGGRSTEVQHALKDINFEIKKGEFFGIVGRNGSGKSTLLKIIAGIYQPTKGSIDVDGKIVPFIELGVGFNPELTGRENVYLNGALLGFSKKEIDDRYEQIVAFAELERFMDQKLKNYSSGMQVRLAFSCATMANADILVVDEVLAVGDSAFQRKCYDYFKGLKKQQTTVVFVTHDMSAVREFCDRAILIESSELKHEGRPDDIAREYATLFLDGGDAFAKTGSKRWGNGNAEYDNIKLTQKGDDIIVEAGITSHKDIEKLLYGIHVVSADGKEITAMNNRMIGEPDLQNVPAGARHTVRWQMLNVFNDGNYTVSLTLADGRENTLDWYNEAVGFTVKRAERSTTDVLPPISVSITQEK